MYKVIAYNTIYVVSYQYFKKPLCKCILFLKIFVFILKTKRITDSTPT
jgi:hypothetical protein